MTNEQLVELEANIMDNLVDAHKNFVTLPEGHDDDIKDWVFHIHALQNILMARIARRDYPEILTPSWP